MNNMTSICFLEILLLLLLHQVYSDEAEPLLRAENSSIEMGYCFGVDYIVVYRSSPEGEQLLGNSSASAEDTSITPPADVRDRIHINKYQHLLGLEIRHLTRMDSGIYRRECWQDQTLVSQHTHRLFVCDEEVESEQIIVREQNRGSELLCNSTSTGLEGTSVRWYLEMYPSYKLTLFLDSSMSLVPLVEELKGAVEVRDSGALLLLDHSMLKNNQHFFCLVIKGKNCLSFQNIYLPDHSESRDMFASLGDRVVLNCPSEGYNQQWETPLGEINDSITKNNQMYVSFDEKSEHFSLVIPAVSDEHSGDYSCISSFVEVQYSLVLCPKKDSKEIFVFEGGDILVDCDAGKGDSQRVRWYRLESSGEYQLIHDSRDETVPVPQDLRGRLILSENGTSLAISNLEVKDLGVYWCVVLEGPHSLEGDDYEDDYDEDYSGDDDLYDTHVCIFKQETILSSFEKTRIGVDLEAVTKKTVTRNFETNITSEPPAASNVTLYGVGAGLVCLLLVGVIVVAVIARRRRARATPKQSGAASYYGLNTDKDIKIKVDPGCTEKLTNNDENA